MDRDGCVEVALARTGLQRNGEPLQHLVGRAPDDVHADDRAVPTYRVTSAKGPQHCDWESATFLSIDDGGQAGGSGYVRDPDGVLADYAPSYQASVPLPADARATGWHRGEQSLWLAVDGSAAYVGTAKGPVERWPRLPDDFGCA